MKTVAASFRDPAGYVYEDGESIYRHVSAAYGPHYDQISQSGLLKALWADERLLRFDEVANPADSSAWKTLVTRRLPFISYPYEWCFSQLRDAALLTLDVQLESLARGAILKDASAYNVTFDGGRPVFIDLLSFEAREDGAPWAAYEQFCRHFLAPLLLASRVDPRLQRMLRLDIDGIPLDLASKLLPRRSYASPAALMHVHLHAAMQKRYNDSRTSAATARKVSVSPIQLKALAESLKVAIGKMELPRQKTTWSGYYGDCTYTDETTNEKLRVVAQWAAACGGGTILDLGANDGRYSRAVADVASLVVSSDFDEAAVEANYLRNRAEKITNVMPLVLDLANPSGGIGWGAEERSSFASRAKFDVVMALALIHHLVITFHITLPMVAAEFARLGKNLIVEFVPPDDQQSQRLAAMRPEALAGYTEEAFTAAFAKHFRLRETAPLPGSTRTLHLFERL